jgi:hypothetical protein
MSAFVESTKHFESSARAYGSLPDDDGGDGDDCCGPFALLCCGSFALLHM